MKKVTISLITLVLCVFCVSFVSAETKVPLGVANLAAKIGYISFSDDAFSETANWDENQTETTLDISDGAYFALEGFYNVWGDVYIGAEVGYTKTDDDIADFLNQHRDTAYPSNANATYNDFSMELEFIPVQLNAKYCFEPVTNLTISLGGGISYNYAKMSFDYEVLNTSFGDYNESTSEDEWLFGGQVFFDVVYKINSFYFGLNATYQITEDWDVAGEDGEDANLNNYRISGIAGYYF